MHWRGWRDWARQPRPIANRWHCAARLDQPNMATESLAGLARVCQVQGDLGRAQAHVEEILQYLGLNSVQPTSDREPASGQTLDGTLSPFQIYLTCCRILEAAQDAAGAGYPGYCP